MSKTLSVQESIYRDALRGLNGLLRLHRMVLDQPRGDAWDQDEQERRRFIAENRGDIRRAQALVAFARRPLAPALTASTLRAERAAERLAANCYCESWRR